MVRFLVDEDMPSSSVAVFERHDYEVTSIRALGMRGAPDEEVMDRAFDNDEIIVTRDKDFGDVLRYPTDTHPGAVIIRLPYTYTAEQINDRLDTFLSELDETLLGNSILVLELGRYRIREL